MKASSLLLFLFLLGLNSCAQKNNDTQLNENSVAKPPADLSKYHEAVFASGCFWCVEGVFESVKGVAEVVSGYAGGTKKNPTYEEVGGGGTGHAEAVTIYYDSSIVDYPSLLKIYFASMDPTQVNGQGPDHGSAYRSLIFYRNEHEKELALEYIEKLNRSGKYSSPIAVEVVPFTFFWKAEDYHQDYVQHHPESGYVQHESIPRIKRFQKEFPDLIKPERLMK